MRQNKENKLRENTIDSLTKCYQITINSIDSSVKKVSTLKEIDPKIKLKEKTINHFTEIRILAEHSFPKLIKALSMGIKEYPDELKLNHNVIQKLVDLNQQNSNELKESASIFQSKHHISNEELIKYGL